MMSSQQTLRSPTPASWLWWLPRITFALFVAAVVALLWLSEKTDREEQRTTLITDVLWLEQDLRFQLSHNEELLGQLRTAAGRDFDSQSQALLVNGSGLRQVFLLTVDGHLLNAHPTADTLNLVGESGETVPSRAAVRLATSLGKPAYSQAYPVEGGDWQFEVHVPIFQEGHVRQVAVGAYSVKSILDQSVPWWLAERYRVRIVSGLGDTLGARSKIDTPNGSSEYEIPFDPPGHGLILEATPYKTPTPVAGRLLSSALVALALLVLWSLWALRRHVQGRLQAEEALRQEHAFRTAMENSLQTGLRARDLEGRITYVNAAFCRMVGWSQEELVGRAPPMPYWVDEDLDSTLTLHNRILSGQGPEDDFEIRLKRRNGEQFWALIHEAPLIDVAGRQTGWMSSVVDITERKNAEEVARVREQRLQATARLVAMGEMASSLAHEINQPLAAIASYNTGCANLIASGEGNTEEIAQVLNKSAEQARRAGAIIRRIYEFVRRSEPRHEDCNLGTIVEETVALVEPDARRRRVQITNSVPTDLPMLKADRVLIGQVVFNLLRNAVEATEGLADAGPVTLSCRSEEKSLHLRIADQGKGIPEDIASRLFEPFFTTKPEGMGMGLAICRGIIESHHGRLWHEAREAGGTCFHILLPLP